MTKAEANNPISSEEKVHPWRHCPKGKHLVAKHQMHCAPSKTHPEGVVCTRREHCAFNESRKDVLNFSEIQYITSTYFNSLSHMPCKARGRLLTYKEADNYDSLIAGWVQYWNEVLKPSDPVEPNLVKALIATESSFKIDPPGKNRGNAHGLMQVMSQTWEILRDHKGELSDHLICVNKDHYLDPSANICAGVRWLFRKKRLASGRLGQEATWIEACAEYKSYLADMISGERPNPDGMEKLKWFYEDLNKCEKLVLVF